MAKDPMISVRLGQEAKARLERAAPPADGQRSTFVREAIRERLERWEAEQADETEGSR